MEVNEAFFNSKSNAYKHCDIIAFHYTVVQQSKKIYKIVRFSFCSFDTPQQF